MGELCHVGARFEAHDESGVALPLFCPDHLTIPARLLEQCVKVELVGGPQRYLSTQPQPPFKICPFTHRSDGRVRMVKKA